MITKYRSFFRKTKHGKRKIQETDRQTDKGLTSSNVKSACLLPTATSLNVSVKENNRHITEMVAQLRGLAPLYCRKWA